MATLPGWNPSNIIELPIDHFKIDEDMTGFPCRINLDNPGSAGIDFDPVFTELTEYGPNIVDNTIVADGGPRAMVAVNNTVFALYTASNELRFSKSEDKGNNWADSYIEGPATNLGIYSAMHAEDVDNIFIVYKNFLGNQISFRSSSNGGESWTGPEAVDTGVIANQAIDIGVGATKIYVTYNKDGDLWVASRLISGGSWSRHEVSTSTTLGMSIHVIDDDNLVVSYGEDAVVDSISIVRMVGGTWQSPQAIESGIGQTARDTSVVASDIDNIYISYTKSDDFDLYFARTSTGSQATPSWTVTEVVDGITVVDTSIGLTGSTVYIAYGNSDTRNLRLATSNSLGDAGSWSFATLDSSGSEGLGNVKLAVLGLETYHIVYGRSIRMDHYAKYAILLDDHRKNIAVTTSDGVTQCYVEIDYWDHENNKANLWFKAPFLSASTDTTFYLYYDSTQADNTTYVGDTGDTAAQSVWDPNFKLVFHMSQDPSGGAGSIKDSTSNVNHGTPQGTMTAEDLVDGETGKAINFDGDDDLFGIPDSASLETGAAGTFEAAVNMGSLPTVSSRIFSKWQSGDLSYMVEVDPTGTASVSFSTTGTGTVSGARIGTLPLSSNEFIAFTNDGTNTRGFLNGKLSTLGIGGIFFDAAADLEIGGSSYQTDRGFDGLIGEIRISDITRSLSWLKATVFTNRDDIYILDTVQDLSAICKGELTLNTYTYMTQRLSNYFPTWTNARNDQQSIFKTFVNPIASGLSDTINRTRVALKGRFLSTASLEEMDIIYETLLGQDFTFQYDTSDYRVPRLIAPTITCTINQGDTPFEINIAENNSIDDFWYKAIPDRINIIDTFLYNEILAITQIGNGKIDSLDTIPAPGKLWINVDGAASFFNTVRSESAYVKISGTNRQGMKDSEVVNFNFNATNPTIKEWRSLDSVEIYNVEPITATIKIEALDFNQNEYINEYESYIDNLTNEKALSMSITELTGKTYLNYEIFTANSVDDLLAGIDTKHTVQQVKLLGCGDTEISGIVDIAIQPDTNRVFVLSVDAMRIYDLDIPYIDSKDFNGKSSDAHTLIDMSHDIAIEGDEITLAPFRQVRNRRIIKYKWDLKKPDDSRVTFIYNDSLKEFEEQTYISDSNTDAWTKNAYEVTNPSEFSYKRLEYTVAAVGQHLFTLSVQYDDGAVDVDKRILDIKTKGVIATFPIPYFMLSPSAIAFNSDNELCILDVAGVARISFNYDTAMIDVDKKVVYTREEYFNIEASYS